MTLISMNHTYLRLFCCFGKHKSTKTFLYFLSYAAAILFVVTGNVAYAAEKLSDDEFAVVNDEVIAAQQYYTAFKEGVRETFYHGKVTDKEMEKFRDSVAQKLIDETLLLQEAKRRDVKPDPAQVKKEIDEETAQFQQQADWEKSKDQIIASVRPDIEKDNIIGQLEQQVRDIPKPSVEQIRQYYKDHPDKFTAPEKWNVSIILLKVDASSPGEVWRETMDFADKLVKKLRDGENFEELARIHSGDESAVNGGNMGYIHSGMLSKPAQKVLISMDAGQISEPVMLLKGVAIFRLNGIQGDRLNPFEKVKDRATDLLERQMADEAWKNLIIKLRESSNININKKVVENATTGPRPQT
jgi:parvulin-like peptidyl-prolyl isomerase